MKKVPKTKKDINGYGRKCRYCDFWNDNEWAVAWHEFTTHGFCGNDGRHEKWGPSEPIKFW